MSVVVRSTRETQIRVEVMPGTGASEIDTTIHFLDHMLVTFARYSGLDVAIALGAAIAALVPPRAARYGDRIIPMDDALVHVAIDLGGRPFYRGPLPSGLYDHWMRSFSDNARATLHLRVLRGTDRHHIVEAGFKALGFALREAFVDSGAVFSTKGGVALQIDPAE